MFAWWYICFAVLAIALIGVVGTVLTGSFLLPDLEAKVDIAHDEWFYNKIGKQQYMVVRNRHEMVDSWNTVSIGVTVIGFIVGFILLMVCIFVPMSCKKDVEYFREQRTYIKTAVENGDSLENISITQKVITYNSWLAESKAELRVYGAWSGYYGSGVEELEPIVIEKR